MRLRWTAPLLLALASGPATAVVPTPAELMPEDTSVRIAGDWMEAFVSIWSQWSKTQKNTYCFTILAEPEDDHLRVSFLPRQREDVAYFTQGGRTDCGAGVTYIVDRKGTVLKRFWMK